MTNRGGDRPPAGRLSCGGRQLLRPAIGAQPPSKVPAAAGIATSEAAPACWLSPIALKEHQQVGLWCTPGRRWRGHSRTACGSARHTWRAARAAGWRAAHRWTPTGTGCATGRAGGKGLEWESRLTVAPMAGGRRRRVGGGGADPCAAPTRAPGGLQTTLAPLAWRRACLPLPP